MRVMTSPSRWLRASLRAMGRGLDATASVIHFLKSVLFIPLGLITGGYALWQGYLLAGVVMLSIGVACAWFVAGGRGWHHPWLMKVGFVAVITCICGCVLLVVGEVLSGPAWFITASTVITLGVWAAVRLMERLDAHSRLPSTVINPAPAWTPEQREKWNRWQRLRHGLPVEAPNVAVVKDDRR